MYICEYCGKVYNDDTKECVCGGTLVEAERCENCGEVFVKDEMFETENGYVCEDCLYSINDIDEVFHIASEETESVEINSFLASAFTVDQIEEILMRELRNSDYSQSIKNYIRNDELWFAERVKN